MSTIDDLIHNIRDLINSPRKQLILLKDSSLWNMLCSCLDTIGDNQLALEAYHKSRPSEGDGAIYLIIYGVMQTLFVQQDAVKNLCDSLKIPFEMNAQLLEIRNIRSDTAGHPTKRGRNKGIAFNFISRPSLSKETFQLMTHYRDERGTVFRSINIPALITMQQKLLAKALKKVLERLMNEEADHRKRYRDDHLRHVFPRTLNYHFSKLYEATYNSHGPVRIIAIANMKQITQAIGTFKRKLEERGVLEGLPGVVGVLESLEYPVSKIENYFEKSDASGDDHKDAEIFVFYIEQHVNDLVDMASEIDEDYLSNDSMDS